MQHTKRILLVAISVFLYGTIVPSALLYAQQRTADSLLTLYHRQEQTVAPDTARIATLNELSFAYRSVSLHKAEEYARLALQRARSIAYTTGEADALRNLSHIYDVRNDTTEALRLLRASYTLFESASDNIGMAKALNNIAGLQNRYDNALSALSYYYRSLALSQQIGNIRLQSMTLTNIASILNAQGATLRSLETYFQAYSLADSANDEATAATILTRIAALYSALDDSAKSSHYYHKALSLQKRIGNQTGTATTLNNLAYMMRTYRNFVQAAEYAEQSLAIRLSLNDERTLPTTYLSLALSYQGMGKHKYLQAKQCYMEAIQRYKAINSKEYIRALSETAKFYALSDSLSQAIAYTTQALSLTGAFPYKSDANLLADVYVVCSEVYKTAKRHQEALRLYERATSLRDSLQRQGKKADLERIESRARIEHFLRDRQLAAEEHQRRQMLYWSVAVVVCIIAGLSVILMIFSKALRKERHLKEIRTNFNAMVAHEFRSPLTSINLAIEILADLFDDPSPRHTPQKYLQQIEHSVSRLMTLLNEVMEVEKIEFRMKKFHPEDIVLDDFCQNVQQEVSWAFPTHREIQYTRLGTNHHIWADPELLRFVLVNLLNNALKYSSEDSPVRFIVHSDTNSTTFLVRDYGIGIPKDELAKLFSTFYRASNVGTIQGTGLGLTIVKQCVNIHGGTIHVKSAVQDRTTFTVVIPHHTRLALANKQWKRVSWRHIAQDITELPMLAHFKKYKKTHHFSDSVK